MKPAIKIVKVRPVVTEEEIRRSMNFDSVVRLYNARPLSFGAWKAGTYLAAGGVVIMSAIYVVTNNKAEPMQSPKPEVVVSSDSSSLAPVTVAPANIITEQVEQKETKDLELATSLKNSNDQEVVNKFAKKDDETVPAFDYVEAEPIDGYPKLYAYFASDLHYPEEAVRDSIQGTLSVSFIINKSGKPENILIENSLGPLFDLETNRLIQNMPAWKPATINGRTVPSRISLPLTFRIIKLAPTKQK